MKGTLILLMVYLAGHIHGWRYHYSNKTMNWTNARSWCQTRYTDMVAIQSQKENDYLVALLPNRTEAPHYWIGISKNQKSDPWTWVGDNSTWIGNRSWAANEPNNEFSTEFCVEIYLSHNLDNRGRWNDEKCDLKKFAVCYQAQCNHTSCERGRCRETINAIRCVCEPGFGGDRCQTVVGCPCPSLPLYGHLNCSHGSHALNSTYSVGCPSGYLLLRSAQVTCGGDGSWLGPRPICTSYKHAVMALAGVGGVSIMCCICFWVMKCRKRKKLTQPRAVLKFDSTLTQCTT